MNFGEKKVEIATALVISLISISFGTLLIQDSGSGFIVMAAKPMPPGTFEIDILGDAYGLYTFCEMFQHFSVNGLKWATMLPTYPPPALMGITVDVASIDFCKIGVGSYHLGVKSLREGSIAQNGATMFSVQCSNGELDFVFSDYDMYMQAYRTVDITGILKGDVHFYIYMPPAIPPFDYQGRELTIQVHIGM